jgi:hypothetical protein
MPLPRCSLRPLAPLVAVGLAVPAAADVLDVRGPHPDFDQIQPAVSAAIDGDVIRVWPGTYEVFTVNDKDLTIVRAKPTGSVFVDGTFRVRNLSPGRTVELTGVGGKGADGYGMVISDCQGPVRVREASITGADAPGGFGYSESWPAVLVERSDDVELVWCELRAGDAPWGEYGGGGGVGMGAVDSVVSLFATDCTGASGTTDDDPGASGYGGGHGVEVGGAGRLYVSGGTLTGGDGGNADYDVDFWTGEYGYGGSGGWAVYAGPTVEVWLLDVALQPGYGGWSPDSTHYGTNGQPAPAHASFLAGRSRLLRASALVDDQTPVTLRAEGAPGDRVYVMLTTEAGYRFHPVRGPFLVADPPFPPRLPWLLLGTIDASGVLVGTLPAADLPLLGHRTLHLQGTFLKHKDYFGSSSWSAILDAAW